MKMLGIGQISGYAEKSIAVDRAEICEPDYEAMLQRERKKIEKVKADIKAYESMNDYYWDSQHQRSEMMALYGAMHLESKLINQRIDEICAEIDRKAQE